MRSQLTPVGRLLAFLVAVALGVGPQMGGALAAGASGNVLIHGVVQSADKGTPVVGARVYAVHLDTKHVFTSAPTGARGEYEITGLPFGYYDLAVEAPDGLFLANRVVNAPAGERIEIALSLGPPQPEDTEWWSAEPDRRIAGLDRTPDGVARIAEGKPRLFGKALRTTSAPGAGRAAFGGGPMYWLVPALAGGGLLAMTVLVNQGELEPQPLPVSPFAP